MNFNKNYSKTLVYRGGPSSKLVVKKKHTPRPYKEKQKCSPWGYEHLHQDKCPAKWQLCDFCEKPGHFASMCKFRRPRKGRHKKTKDHRKQKKKINLLQDELTDTEDSISADSDCDGMHMGVIHDVNWMNPETDWTVKCKVGNTTVTMHVDTGAKCNVISDSVL
jgi:hypothetical protein